MCKQLRDRIHEIGLVLPPAPTPAGVYRPILIINDQLLVSGQGPVKEDGSLMQGRVGSDLNKEQGKIQDARVIAFKTKTAAGKYNKGIYREHTPSSGKYRSYLKPLFIFKEIPTQKGKFTFRQRVKFFADKKVFKYWSREIKRLAKE